MKILLYLIIIASLFLPFSVSAGWLSGPIVPCGRDLDGSGQIEENEQCTLCHIFELARNVIQFLLQFVLVIAPVFILIGGIMILASAGTPDRVALGKRIITSAVIGVVIALGAWAILGTLFNALIGGPGFPWAWNEFHC